MKSFVLAALLGAIASARNRKVSVDYPSYIPVFTNDSFVREPLTHVNDLPESWSWN
jgi:hypothetical protein